MSVDYAMFLKPLFASHGIQGQGMKYPEHISAPGSIPTNDLKGAFPKFPKADFQEGEKILALLHNVKTHYLAGSTRE